MTAHGYTQKVNRAKRLLLNKLINFGRFHIASNLDLKEMNEVEIATHFTVIKSYIDNLANGKYDIESDAIADFVTDLADSNCYSITSATQAQAYATGAALSLDPSASQFSDLEITNRSGIRSTIPADIPDLWHIARALQENDFDELLQGDFANEQIRQSGLDVQLVWNLLHAARDHIITQQKQIHLREYEIESYNERVRKLDDEIEAKDKMFKHVLKITSVKSESDIEQILAEAVAELKNTCN